MKIPKTFPAKFRDTGSGFVGSVLVSFDPVRGLILPASFLSRLRYTSGWVVLLRDSSPWLRFFQYAQVGKVRILVSA